MINKIKDSYIWIYTIYFIIIFLNSTSIVIDYEWIGIILSVVRHITYIYFTIRLFLLLPDYKKELDIHKWKQKTKTNKFVIIIAFIILISTVINHITTGNNKMIILLLVILSSYKVDYKKLLKQTMSLQIILTSIVVLVSILGITQNYLVIRISTIPQKERYSLGFGYVTNLAQLILFSSLLFLYNKNFKAEYLELFAIQILNIFTFFITDSKTEFMVLEFIIVMVFLNKYRFFNNISKKIMKIFSYSFFMYPIISFILVLLYPLGGIFDKINNMLSRRLQYPYNVLQEHGITLFGKNIEFVGFGLGDRIKYGDTIREHYNFVDNEYILIMFREGLIIAICFIIIMSLLVIMLYKKKKYNELFLCGIYLVFGLMNPRIISLMYCPILFLIIPIFAEYFKSIDREKSEVTTK